MFSPDATRTALLPWAGPLNGSHIQFGGVPLRRLLAYQYEQAALPYSFDNRTDCIRQELPAGSSFGFFHIKTIWNGGRHDCGEEQPEITRGSYVE